MAHNWQETLEKARAHRDLSVFDIVSIDDLTDKDVALVLELAELFQKSGSAKIPLLTGKTVINLFYENSTRTRSSFELAGKHLDADVTHISAVGSSVKKGESLLDTAQTLSALQSSALVIRISESGVLKPLCKEIAPAILNAGDGVNEHPSQALLDAKTMIDHHKTLEGKVVVIVGDLMHSRVFGSLVRLLPRLGAMVRGVCPETLMPEGKESLNAEFFTNLDDASQQADVLYAIRMQAERGAEGHIKSLEDYAKSYTLRAEHLEKTHKDAILMDAGPVIRDLSISTDIVDHPQSKILTQVENGLAVRKALLYLTCDRKDGNQKHI